MYTAPNISLHTNMRCYLVLPKLLVKILLFYLAILRSIPPFFYWPSKFFSSQTTHHIHCPFHLGDFLKIISYEGSWHLSGLTIGLEWYIFFFKTWVTGCICTWTTTYIGRLLRGSCALIHVYFQLALQCPALHIRVNPSTPTLYYNHLSSLPLPFWKFYLSFLHLLFSCHHYYLHKELNFLPRHSSPPPFFFQRENKALTNDSFDEMARKTAFLHWHLQNIAQWFGTHLFLPPPSIFALWLLTFAALTPHSVLLYFQWLAARFSLVSLIYWILLHSCSGFWIPS